MLKDTLVAQCAPTLAGIKTGNIFSVKNTEVSLVEEMRELNRILTKKGLRLIPIQKKDKFTLIYVYRPYFLKRDLNNPEAQRILKGKGYHIGNDNQLVVQLVWHLMNDKEFPHEIGLFLGYPPSDVKGFMESPSEGVKSVGCWKVYSNPEHAKKVFESYKICTDIYCEECRKGKSLENLAVEIKAAI